MASKNGIINLALGHIGVSQTIDDIDTDTTNEAKAINRYYDTVLLEVFGEYDWPFASKTITLAEISTTPTTEWGYEYQYQTNCAKFLRLYSGVRNETDTSWVAYELAMGDTTTVIYTDEASAVGEYTGLITDEALYPTEFVMALSWRLAFYIAPTLMTGDPFKLREAAGQFAQVWINKAASKVYNESPKERHPKSLYVRSRV